MSEEEPYPYENLARLYDEQQRLAQKEYEEEIKAIQKTNPHNLYKEIVTKPSPKGKYMMRIMGRPLDLAALENYLVFKISPRTITTLMRYNDSKTIEETRGFSRRKTTGLSKGFFFMLIIAIILLLLGVFLFFGGGNITGIFQGFMGG